MVILQNNKLEGGGANIVYNMGGNLLPLALSGGNLTSNINYGGTNESRGNGG